MLYFFVNYWYYEITNARGKLYNKAIQREQYMGVVDGS